MMRTRIIEMAATTLEKMSESLLSAARYASRSSIGYHSFRLARTLLQRASTRDKPLSFRFTWSLHSLSDSRSDKESDSDLKSGSDSDPDSGSGSNTPSNLST